MEKRKNLIVLLVAGGIVAGLLGAAYPILRYFSLMEVVVDSGPDASRSVFTVWRRTQPPVRHGEFRSYWPQSPLLYSRGQYSDGQLDGVWTYWDEDGRVAKQCRYAPLRTPPPSMTLPPPLETKREPPWWEGAADQVLPDGIYTRRRSQDDAIDRQTRWVGGKLAEVRTAPPWFGE
ncbi:MAG: hypothetical protein L0Z55_02660 [Planctomycetes bacterium]|nr:hypothetical protein [Planctomycetota bacterium]